MVERVIEKFFEKLETTWNDQHPNGDLSDAGWDLPVVWGGGNMRGRKWFLILSIAIFPLLLLLTNCQQSESDLLEDPELTQQYL